MGISHLLAISHTLVLCLNGFSCYHLSHHLVGLSVSFSEPDQYYRIPVEIPLLGMLN